MTNFRGNFHRWSRAVAPIAAIVAVLSVPTLLWAHARLTKSDPAANSTLSEPPKAIALWFSEAPELAMTKIILSDSAGARVSLGPVERGDSKLAIRLKVPTTLRPGRYTVTWRVAAADGHPSNGSFKFSVAARHASADSAVKPNAAAADNDVGDVLSPAQVVTRAIAFVAILLVIGGVAFVLLILRRAPNLAPAARDIAAKRTARLIAVALVVLLATAGERLWFQQDMMSHLTEASVGIGSLVTGTAWGRAWLLQVGTAVVALVLVLLATRVESAIWSLLACVTVLLAASPAMSGHAAAAPQWTAFAVGADTLHVLGAAGWLGSLAFVLVVGVPVLNAFVADDRWSMIASLVNTFSPVALLFASIVVLTGIASATLRLGSVPALWTSGYGRTLLIKLALLLGVLGTGAFNWRRVRPALGSEVATTRLRRSASVELAVAVLVVIVTAVLVATPTPADAL
jgi:copper transport protein